MIGVWTTASPAQGRLLRRRTATARRRPGSGVGPFSQVSRLGNPLFNEVLVPMERKDYWNTQPPTERQPVRRRACSTPSSRKLLPVLYPGVFPNLAALERVGQAARRPRRDPAHRHPDRRRSRLPELGRFDAGRPAAPEHGDPADDELAQQPRPDRRRRRRLPERAPRVRRRVHDRAARDRGRDLRLVDPTFTPDGAANAVYRRPHDRRRSTRPPRAP